MIENKIIMDGIEYNEFYKTPVQGTDRKDHYYNMVLKSRSGDNIIPVLLLNGSTMEKEKLLRDFVTDTDNIHFRSRIAIYSGIISMQVKYIARTFNIDLCKTLILVNADIKKIITVKDQNDSKKSNINTDKKSDHHREKIYIIKEIMELIINHESVNITKIIYNCNLNYEYATAILEYLIQKEFIVPIEYQNSIKYSVTTKGKEYFKTLSNI